MMRFLFLMLAMGGMAGLARAGEGDDARALAEGNRAFALELYARLAADDRSLFFSPHSISVALGMTYAGAAGETAAQMASVLRFPLTHERLHAAFGSLDASLRGAQGDGVQLHTANSIWPMEGEIFLEPFLATVRGAYRSDVFPTDFRQSDAARGRINTWVEEQTNEKIKDLIPSGVLSELTRMVLVNAVYFKGDWAKPFVKDATAKRPFYPAPGVTNQVDTMTGKIPARYAVMDDVQLLELPYEGGGVVMLIALPVVRGALRDVESKLGPETLVTWERVLEDQDVMVILPKLTMTSAFSLSTLLREMGMTDAFDASLANFSGMDGRTDNLFISEVVHKAFVDVNEEGTEAAAATGVIMATRAMMPRPAPEFRADHPFLFFIQDTATRSILFAGRFTGEAAAP